METTRAMVCARGLQRSFVALWFAAGCDLETGVSQQETQSIEQELYSQPDAHTWPTHDIPVCYNPGTWNTPRYRPFMTEVQALVENTFGRVTDLRFHGWGQCNNPGGGTIQIFLNDGYGGVTDPGYNPYGSTELHCGTKPEDEETWDPRAMFMHEFAHALGFDHEIDRPDPEHTPCHPSGGLIEGTNYTDYDNDSILNSTYCFQRLDLSPWDVVGLQRVYGRKPARSLVGASNKCADIENPGGTPLQNATRVQGYTCLGNGNQSWWYDAQRRLVAGFNNYGFMDVQWGNPADGTPIWNWTSNPGPAQTWEFDRVQVVGMGDLCLEVPNNSWFVGQTVRLATCDIHSNAQRWTIQSSGNSSYPFQIRGNSPGGQPFCVSLNGANQNATLATCASTGGTPLYLHLGHFLGQNSTCLDVQWGRPVPGTTVWGWQCNWGSNPEAQLWKLRGPVRGLAGKCLDLDLNGGIHDGSKVQLWQCHGGPNQSWEYSF